MAAAAHRLGAALGIASLAVCAGRVVAQGPSDRPTFRVASTLIELTMTARDGNGNPVTDLRQDEIVITENGKPREVAFFRFEGAIDNAPAFVAKPLPPAVFTNRIEYTPGPPRNITAIVIDAVNTRPEDQMTVRSQVLSYLSTIPVDARIALYRAGERVHILHDFTDDIASLRARMSKQALEATIQTQTNITVEKPDIQDFLRQAFDSEYLQVLELSNKEIARFEELSNQQIQDRRSNLTLASLEALGDHLAGIPGRKSVVWITAGTPMATIGAGDPWLKTYERAIRDTSQRLATQGVTLYPVEATGLRPVELKLTASGRGDSRGSVSPTAQRAATTGANQPASLAALSTTPDQVRLPSALDLLADVTGGRFLRNTNDLTAGMKAAASDLRSSYSLGFYTPEDADDKWHPFKVQVRRPGVKIVSRQGYLGVAPKQPREWQASDWRDAANNPLRSTGVRIEVRCVLASGVVRAEVQLAADDLHLREMGAGLVAEFEIAVAEKTADGLSGLRHEALAFQLDARQAQDPSAAKVRFPKQWPIAPTTTMLRLIVYDRFSDRYGTVDVPVSHLQGSQI
ncbi:MAG: VWA domain-containing protein [Vicinamibacterales bacterium]|nr:VWA domain-containing protein [Vicinamibacterales bacterium]